MEYKLICPLLWLLVNYLSFCASENSVPVLLWESKNTGDQFHTVPALAEYDTDEFLNHFLKKIKSSHSKPLVVVFLENTLSLEDFSWRDSSKKQAFSNVKELINKANGTEFLPAVSSAADAIQKLEAYGYSQKDLKDLKGNEKGVFTFVRFDDAGSNGDRPNLLNLHDELIGETVKKLLGFQSNVICMLTGKDSAWIEPEISLSRMRRALQAAESNETVQENGLVFNASGKVLLQTSEAPILTVDGETVTLPTKHKDQLDTRPESSFIRLISTFEGSDKKIILRFKFEMSSGYWTLKEVEYTFGEKNGLLTPTKAVKARSGASYINLDSQKFESENKTSSLLFKSLKTQAWTRGEFGQAESKVGFFTAPIWSGILVVGMLALIMVWGLIMILDIKTMDQFDDPKGKTISINASE